MSGTGKIGRAFCERWGERTVSGAVRKALGVLLPMAKDSPIPVDLITAAKCLGVEQVLEADELSADGLLSLTPSGNYIATLRRGQSRARRRFTLAHELGHLVVFRSIEGLRSNKAKLTLQCDTLAPSDREEERLCDIVAAELLMPHGQVVAVMEQLGVCASTIPLVAKRFDVSSHAAARRVVQLLPYDIGICLWRMSADGAFVTPSWYVTKKGSLSLPYAIPAAAAGSELFGEQPTRGWRWLALQGQMDKYFIDLHPSDELNGWIVLVVFDNAAEHILNSISIGKLSQSGGQQDLLR